ncbi:hypothetical protein [Flexivirga oryzae]|uniref:Uncharacterized protein n=1 Tax=Flexivirga oryzae TaxID=1794944 RepID=A0A839MZA2_9MICO|nr:hypothetical protein [Flexivirga oryzae]MBB2890790.1 hypothetical protein [Flexivirga oryzae]
MMYRDRWIAESAAFLLWGLTSTVGLLAFLTVFTIGIFVLPVAVVFVWCAFALTFRKPAREFTMVGVLLGPAVWSLYIGITWAARDFSPDGRTSHLVPLRFLPYAGVTAACLATAVALFVVVGVRIHRRPDIGGKYL